MEKIRKPNLFIVGAAKSGTSSLKDWLNQHPDIYFCPIETNFFAKDVEGSQDRITTITEYLAYFRNAGNQKYIGEKAVRYLVSKEAPKKIKDLSPNAKVIIILRDPAEMLFSWHRQLRRMSFETEPDFSKALEKEKERQEKDKGKEIRTFFYSDMIDYYSQVKRYYNLFGRNNIKVILFGELKNNQEKTYQKILEFLGVRKFKPEFRVINPGVYEPRSKLYSNLIYSLQRLSPPIKRAIKKIVPPSLTTRVKRSNLKEGKRKTISLELKRKLYRTLKPGIIKLEKLIQKNLSVWYEEWS